MIIGISGKKQHGKDTLASIIEYITNEYNQHGQIINTYNEYLNMISNLYLPHWNKKRFAEKLKQIVCLLISCTMEQLEDNTFKEKELDSEWTCWMIPNSPYPDLFPKDIDIEWIANGRKYFERRLTPRMLLQLIGTECCRNIIHPNIWVNATMADYKEDPKQDNEYTDRHPNWIITDVRFPNEAKAIKDRGGILIRVHRDHITNNDKHPSEISLDNYTEWDSFIQNNSNIDNLIYLVEANLKRLKII